MRRGRNLSNKVPNVKLRPKPRPSTRRHPSPSADAEVVSRAWDEAEAENEPAAGPSTGDKPWRKIVVTFTGVDDKAPLTELVKELGGKVDNALTIHVTHVVAEGHDSAKYHYAVEHRIPVLTPSWIKEAHKRWIDGEELDVPASIKEHRLLPFAGLRIAVSGIAQLDRRRKVIDFINSNGGTYHKDLDRKCTHLVSAQPTTDPKSKQSEKIKWALKQLGERDMARRRGRRVEGDDIRIVYEEWIWDCIAFAGRFKEDKYDARKPRGRGRVRAEDVLDGSAFVEPEPKAAEDKEDENEPVVVRKRKRDEFGSLVGELLSTSKVDAKPDPAGSHLPSPRKSPPREAEDLPSRGEEFDRKPSVLHASRLTSFSAPAPAGPAPLPAPVSLAGATGPTTSSIASTNARSTGSGLPPTSAPAAGTPRRTPEPIFGGLRFSHAIAEGCQGLEEALAKHGGTLITEKERLAGAQVDYVIVRLSARMQPPMPEHAPDPLPTVVTECWVEGSCFQQRLLSPDDNLVFRPLSAPAPIPGAENILAHISGFPTETTVYLKRLLKTIGGTLSEKLNRRTSHLICAAPAGPKYTKANEWRVTVVRDSWLWTMGRTGQLQPIEEHLHEPSTETKPSISVTANLTSNLSVISDADLSRTEVSAVGSGSLAASGGAGSLPASRMLQLTPTHIDDAATGDVASAAGSAAPPEPLTSPRVAERLLNRARANPSPGPTLASRTASAPASSPRQPDPELAHKPGVPTPSAPGALGVADTTMEALKLLAAKTSDPPRSKATRRSRPSRGKTDPSPASASASASTSTSPAKPTAEPQVHAPPQIADESIHVTYGSAAEERERKRLIESAERQGTSPKKRRV